MNRLTLVATIGAVLVAAILGLIYAVSKQDVDDTPAPPAAQEQPAEPPAQPAATPPATPAPAEPTAAAEPSAGQPAAGTQAPVMVDCSTGA